MALQFVSDTYKQKYNYITNLIFFFFYKLELEIDSSEILIKNIKHSSKLDAIYCQISNGYGATASRVFRINVRHIPYMLKKSKTFKVPIRTQELLLNCSATSNPLAKLNWLFLPSSLISENNSITDWKLLNKHASITSFMKPIDQLPISKYYINEHVINEKNHINSILIIKVKYLKKFYFHLMNIRRF